MRRAALYGISLVVLGSAALPMAAQNVIGAKSGVINWVEGNVYLGDHPYTMQPSQFGEVKENMILRTQDGRAEVLLPPGVFFRLAENSSFRMISNRLIDTRVELLAGSGIIEVEGLAKEATVTVVLKNATVALNKSGLYRFDAAPAALKVFKGEAEATLDGRSIGVSAGKMLAVGSQVAAVEKFDVAETDSFDHWSRRRGELVAEANISAAKQASGYSGYSSGYAAPVSLGYGGLGYAGLGYGGWGYPGFGMNPCYGFAYGPSLYAQPWGAWGFNPYYGMATYIPCQGSLMSPYGFAYWSPMAAYQAFYSPRPLYTFGQRRGPVIARMPGVRPIESAQRGIARMPQPASAGGFGGFSGSRAPGAASSGSGGLTSRGPVGGGVSAGGARGGK